MILMNYNKYEKYIRIGSTPNDLKEFPTPTGLNRALRDVDKDAYTDLLGYTHRNRIRHDVEDITLTYEVLSSEDEAYILNAISPEWVYVELIDKKTKQKVIHKMYAGDKQWDTYYAIYNSKTGNWEEITTAFSFTLTEE